MSARCFWMVAAGFALAARAGTLYVATTGSDTTGDGSQANPYLTVQKAVTNSANYGEIRVQGGLYVGNVSIPNTIAASNLTFTGSWTPDWSKQDYCNARTILKSKSTGSTTIFIANVQTNSFDGFDITGGYNGVDACGQNFNGTSRKVFGPYTHFIFTHCIITNNASNGLYHNVNGNGDGDYGYACASCLIAFNGGYGVWVKNDQDTSSHCYFYNCTIVSNKYDGIYGYGAYKNYLRNSIVAYNGTRGSGYDLYASNAECKMLLEYACTYGGKTASTGGNSGAYLTGEQYVALDPQFTGLFELSEYSKCNKRGTDLSADAILPVASDLYGTAWAGEYDFGCRKSDYYVPSSTYDDVYVAADGSDNNTGADADHPVATFGAALLALNSGGTLHVGAGTYGGSVSLSGNGARIIGAGRSKTVIKTKDPCGVAVNGHSQRVEGLTLDGCGTGVNINQVGGLNPTNIVIRDCEIRNCTSKGVYMVQDNVNNTPYTNFFSHCVISNCSSYGIHGAGIHSGSYRRGRFLVDNCLFAYNGNAFNSDFQPPSSGANLVHFVNCTVVSNKSSGVTTGTNLPLTFTNCILFGNGSKNAGTGGGTLTLDHSLCNALLSPGGTLVQNESYVSHEPKFGPGFTLTEDSLANKTGLDVSGDHSSYATDLAAASWSGAYDMGCFKSPYAKYVVKTWDEVWVAKGGSNDNEGNTPDAPLATLPGAQVKLKAGGTVHLGPGTFTENNFTLYGAGAKLLGEGPDQTVVKISSGCGVIVAGHSSRVEGIAFEGATGVRVGEADKNIATNVVVRNCTFRKCTTGWYAQQDCSTSSQFTNFVSHCTFSNCTSYAFQWQGMHSGSARYGRLLADTCLIVRNKGPLTSDVQPPGGSYKGPNQHTFLNCTVVSNTAGFATGTNLGLVFLNSILADNGATLTSQGAGSWQTFRHVLCNGALSDRTKSIDAASVTNLAGVAALKFSVRPGKAYWPTAESPARKFGDRALAAGFMARDLAGREPKGVGGWDAGCYFALQPGTRLIVR